MFVYRFPFKCHFKNKMALIAPIYIRPFMPFLLFVLFVDINNILQFFIRMPIKSIIVDLCFKTYSSAARQKMNAIDIPLNSSWLLILRVHCAQFFHPIIPTFN